ncbi:MAG TPA: class I SAM-dependent methyltransferase, partial [Chloroflexota bacterium]|nr:class I SAM-dependent methyltransferase [Chloroflexota bacterium]
MTNLVYDVRRYYRTVAQFIDAELADRGDCSFWQAVGRDHRRGRILELGCGSGRVTELLASSGARVMGLDISTEMLALARKRLARHNVWLVMGDLRELPLRGRFNVIVAPDDPFSHLTSGSERQQALCALASQLEPNGRLIVDALWFSEEEERQRSATGGQVLRHTADVRGRRVQVTERWS